MTTEAMLIFTLAWPSFEKRIENYARQLVYPADAYENLVHKAMITLWKCDPSAFAFLDPKDVAYRRDVVKNSMRELRGRRRSVSHGQAFARRSSRA